MRGRQWEREAKAVKFIIRGVNVSSKSTQTHTVVFWNKNGLPISHIAYNLKIALMDPEVDIIISFTSPAHTVLPRKPLFSTELGHVKYPFWSESFRFHTKRPTTQRTPSCNWNLIGSGTAQDSSAGNFWTHFLSEEASTWLDAGHRVSLGKALQVQTKQTKGEKSYIFAIDSEDPPHTLVIFLRGNQLWDLQLDSRTSNCNWVARK